MNHPAGAPFTLDSEPLWDSEHGGPFPGADLVAVRGDQIIMSGLGEKGGREGIAVLDAKTGATRWSVGATEDLAGQQATSAYPNPERAFAVVGGEDFSVVVPYRQHQPHSDEETYGLAVLSKEDGRARKFVPVLHNVDSDEVSVRDQLHMGTWMASGSTAVITVVPVGPDPGPEALAKSKTVAVDLVSGQVKWEHAGQEAFHPAALLDSVVVGYGSPASSMAAFDVDTGARLWTVEDRYPLSSTVASVPGDDSAGTHGMIAVSVLRQSASQGVAVLDANTGREIVAIAGADDCTGDSRQSIACTFDYGDSTRLLTISAADQKPMMSGREIESPFLDNAHGGTVFASDPGDKTSMAYDDAGNVRATDIPGKVAAISDRYVVLFRGSAARTSGYAVHRIAQE